MSAFFALVLIFLAIFLILLVLVQRGRGGGLAGALGGMGGSSAFGAKAGDVFTRITIITASIWIVISIIVFFWAKHRGDALDAGDSSPAANRAMDLLPQERPGDEKSTVPAATTEKTGAAPADNAPANSASTDEVTTTPPTATQQLPPSDAEKAPQAEEN